MKYLTEKIVLGIVVLVLGYIFLHNVSGSDHIIHYIYNYASYGYMVLIFVFMGLQWIGDPAQTWKNTRLWKVLGVIIGGGWFTITVSYGIYVQHLTGNPMQWWHIFHPFYLSAFLETLAPGLVLGMLYGYIRRLILISRKKRLKQFMLGAITLTATGVLIFAGLYFWDVSYEGNQQIRILDKSQELDSLEEVLGQPELEGKKVYIDLWFSTCGPCIQAFKKMGPAKKLLDKKNIVTLYLGKETSHPNSKQLWINAIKDYQLEGFHVYMSEELEQEIITGVSKYIDRYFGYPHYLIVNEKGEIVNWDAPGVQNLSELENAVAKLNKNEGFNIKR